MKNEMKDDLLPSPHSETHVAELTCCDVLDQLEAHLDGELAPTRLAAMTRHLRICAACADELAWARQVRGGLRGLPRLTCPPGLLETAAATGNSAASTSEPLADVVSLASRRPRSAVPETVAVRRDVRAWRPLLAAAIGGLAVALTLLWVPGLSGPGAPTDATTQGADAATAGVSMAEVAAAGVEVLESTASPADPFALDTVPRVSPLGPAAVPGGAVPAAAALDAQALAQAEDEMRFALAYINGIHRQAALALRDQMREHVAAAPYRSLQRLSLIDTPSSS